jgi:hypothetical protein
MHEIKKIKILSLANIVALICGSVAFLSAEIFYCHSVISAASRGSFKFFLVLILVNFGLGFLISLFFALITGMAGWIIGILSAWFYNFFACEIGGVKIEFADEAIVSSDESPKIDKQKLFKY